MNPPKILLPSLLHLIVASRDAAITQSPPGLRHICSFGAACQRWRSASAVLCGENCVAARMQPAATRPVSQLAAPVTPRVRSRGLEHRQLTSGPGTCRGAPAVLDHPCAEREAVTDGQLQKLQLITAIKTPYLTTGRFDLRTFDSIVEHQARTRI